MEHNRQPELAQVPANPRGTSAQVVAMFRLG
jgi:hypothetical protein